MSSVAVLVDTSVWIPYLRRGHQPSHHPIRQLGEENRLATNWLVCAELLSGAADEADYAALARQLQALRHIDLLEDVWAHAARLRWALRRQGLNIPLVDTAIASSAIVHECELLHFDRHFDLIARHAPLKLYNAKSTKQN